MAGTNPQLVVRIAANLEELRRNLAEGKASIEAIGPSVAKMATTWNQHSTKLVQDANNITAAVQKVGAGALTAGDSAQALKKLEAGMVQLARESKPIPPLMQQTADKLRAVSESKAGGFFSDLGNQIKATALGFISAQAVIGAVKTAFGLLTAFVSGSIKSFAESEAAQKKLTVSLKSMGQAAPETVKNFNALASEFQRTTTYSDDLITEMQALLVQVGNVAPSQMQKALQAATDLSAGLGIELPQATMLVAKAFAGGGDELGRLKAILGDTVIKGGEMSDVLDAIDRKFGGQAQGEIETYAGKVKQLANDWDNLKEAVGRAIVEDPIIAAILRDVGKAAREAADGAGETKRGIMALGAEWATGSKAVGDYVFALEELISRFDSVRVAAERMAKMPHPAMFGPGEGATVKGLDWQQYLADYVKGQKAAEAAAEKAVRAEAKYWLELAKAQERAREAAEANRITFQMSTQDAIAALERRMKLPAIVDMQHAILTGLPDVTAGIDNIARTLGDQFNSSILKVTLPKVKQGWADMFGQMLGDSARFLGGGGGPWNALKDVGTTFAKDFTSQMLSFIPGIGPIISKFAGPLVDGVKKLFGGLFGSAGRDAVKDFAASMGGFDELHVKLNALPAGVGETLWKNLTQGVGKNNPQAAKAAIEAITAALEQQKTKEAEVAQAAADSAAAQQAAIDEITAKYSESISKLESEYKSLAQSVAAEAEEAEMGVIETQQRARMVQIEAEKAAQIMQRDAEIAAKQETFSQMLEAGKTVDDQLRDVFSRPHDFPIRFTYPGGMPIWDPTGSTPSSAFGGAQAAGGEYLTTRPTWFLSSEHSRPEHVSFSGEGRTSGRGAGPQQISIPVYLDGMKIGQGFAELRQRLGLGVS